MGKFVFSEEELDWIDNGHGFGSDTNEPWGDEVADSIITKLRDAWNNKSFIVSGEYELDFTDEEVEFICDIMEDFIFSDSHSEIHRKEDSIVKDFEQALIDFKGFLEITNSVFKKFGKAILTLEGIKNEILSDDDEELDHYREEQMKSLYKKYDIPVAETETPHLKLIIKLFNLGMNISEFLKLSLDEINNGFNLQLDNTQVKEIKAEFCEIQNSEFLKEDYKREFLRAYIKDGMVNEEMLNFYKNHIGKIFN